MAVYTLATLSLDTSARYSTKSVTKNISWEALGVSNAEWTEAVAQFRDGKYWFVYPKGSEWLGLVYNTLDSEWYPVDDIEARSFYQDENYFYYAGDNGQLRVFDDTLYSDWDDVAKTTATAVNAYWYSKLMNPKLTGLDHFWDVLMIEARQFMDTSSIDVEVNTYSGQYSLLQAIATSILIIGQTPIGVGQIANINLTDIINEAKRLETFLKGQYAQIKLANNRDEPFEVFSLIYETRIMTKY